MSTTHTQVSDPATFNGILRTRMSCLIKLHSRSFAAAARSAGIAESTLYRRLNMNPGNAVSYRRMSVGSVDQLLNGLGLEPDAALVPVLLDGDREVLTWIGERTPSDPLPSRALWSDVADHEQLARLIDQGLAAIYGDPSNPGNSDAWYLRLTPAGQRALA